MNIIIKNLFRYHRNYLAINPESEKTSFFWNLVRTGKYPLNLILEYRKISKYNRCDIYLAVNAKKTPTERLKIMNSFTLRNISPGP